MRARVAVLAVAAAGACALLAWLALRDRTPRSPGSGPRSRAAEETSDAAPPPRPAPRTPGASSLHGVVLRRGQPVAATVEVRRLEGFEPPTGRLRSPFEAPLLPRPPARIVSTRVIAAGADGAFALDVAPGWYVLVARTPDGAGASSIHRAEVGRDFPVALALVPWPCTLAGRAEHVDGRPYRGEIRLEIGLEDPLPGREDPPGPVHGEIAVFRTNAEGRFRLPVLPGTRVALGVLEPGRHVEGPTLILPHEEEVRLVVDGPSRRVSGIVVDAESGAALPGASVVLEGGRGPAVTVWASADGAGRFEADVPSGPLVVTASAPGHAATRLRDETGSAIRVELLAHPVVSGRVLADEDGAPVPGVTVHLLGTGLSDVSDDAGRYRLAVPAGTGLRFVAVGAGRVSRDLVARPRDDSWLDSFSAAPGARVVREPRLVHDIRVVRAAALRGRVVDGSGAPVPGVEVHRRPFLSEPGGMFGRRLPRLDRPAARTDDEARFSFGTVMPGCPVLLEARMPDGRAAREVVVLAADEIKEVELRLRTPETLDVVVVARETGRPLSGVELRIAYRAPYLPGPWFTDASGHAAVDFPTAGFLLAELPGREATVAEVPRGATALRIEMEPGHVVAGRVLLPDGSPAAGARIGTGRTDANGRFRIEDAPGTPWSLDARLALGERVFRGSLTVESPSEDLVLTLAEVERRQLESERTTPVRILVRDGAGRPVPLCSLWHWNEQDGGVWPVERGETVMDVPAGQKMRFEARDACDRWGHPLPLGPVSSGPAIPDGEVVLVMPPEKVVAGVLLDPSGRGLPGVRLRLRHEDLLFWTSTTTTGPDGSFRFGRLDGREYGLDAELPDDLLPVGRGVTAPDAAVVLRTEPAVTARIRVRDAEGAPVPLAAVAAGPFRGRTDARGEVLVRWLDARKTYELTVRPPGGGDVRPVRLEAWAPADREIVLED